MENKLQGILISTDTSKNVMNTFLKKIFFFIACLFLASVSFAQNNGIVPLTGLKYFSEGIVTKDDIDVKIDGAQLLSNRIPLNKEIDLILHQPAGFTIDAKKTVFAGAELTILSPKGELLYSEPNILAKNATIGFTAKELINLGIKFIIPMAAMRNNFNGLVKLRLYDLKSKNQLRIEMPVTFARLGEQLQVSKLVKNIKSTDAAKATICGLQARSMKITVDTSIQVAPKMAYTSVDISNIKGTSISGIFSGKENFWVYDNNLNEIKITDILLKQVKGAMENNDVDYMLKIPYRLKTVNARIYTVRFRWESPDKKQVIDVVVKNI
ncbi:MAG: hypothetical protein KF825_02755 [Ferruginibacter sp.]|nr:hypothetical protein [Ferruginibacter sp.]